MRYPKHPKMQADLVLSSGRFLVKARRPFLHLCSFAVFALVAASSAALEGGEPLWIVKRDARIAGVVSPVDVAFDSGGGLYVASSIAGRIESAVELTRLTPEGDIRWRSTYEPPDFVAHAMAMAVAADGSIYVSGSLHPGHRNEAFVPVEFLLLKYHPNGELLWQARADAAGSARHVAAMPDGGVVVCGRGAPGAPGAYDIVTLRYDATGTLLWRRDWNGPHGLNDRPEGLAADPDGNIYITGIADEDYWSCDDDEEDCPALMVTVSYTPDGGLRWESLEGVGYSSGTALHVTSDAVYVAGFTEPESRHFAYAVVRYDATRGDTMWTGQFQPEDRDDRPQSILIAESGDILLGGQTLVAFAEGGDLRWYTPLPVAIRSLQGMPGGGSIAVGNTQRIREDDESIDMLVFAHDAEGALTWDDRYDGPAGGDDWPAAIQVSEAGEIVVVGGSDGEYPLHESVVIGYDGSGERTWVKRHASTINARESAADRVAVDKDGEIYVTGVIGSDVATIRYSSRGEEVWAYFPPAARFPQWHTGGIAVMSGRIFVTGGSYRRTSADGEGTDLETFALDRAGQLMWRRRIDRGRVDQGFAITAHWNGTLVAAGYSQGPVPQWDPALVAVAYDRDGGQLWFADAGERSFGNDLAVGKEGGVYAVGTTGPVTDTAIILVSIGPDGAERWQRTFDGPDREYGKFVRSDSHGDVWVFGEGARGSRRHTVLLRYASDGENRWHAEYRGQDGTWDTAGGLMVNDNGHAAAGVTSRGEDGTLDAVVLQYDPDGQLLGEYRYDGPAGGDDSVVLLKRSPTGTLWLAVSSEGIDTGCDIVLVELDASTLAELQAWRWTSEGEVDDRPRDVAFSPQGDLIVAGSSGDHFLTMRFASGDIGSRFVRGDTNGDGRINLSDASFILAHLFADGDAPRCLDAADANDNGTINLADAISVLVYMFSDSPGLPAPFPDCGIDATADDLDCRVGTCGK